MVQQAKEKLLLLLPFKTVLLTRILKETTIFSAQTFLLNSKYLHKDVSKCHHVPEAQHTTALMHATNDATPALAQDLQSIV